MKFKKIFSGVWRKREKRKTKKERKLWALKSFRDRSNIDMEELRKAQQEGMTLYGGTVDFECCDYHYSEIFQRIWNVIEKEDDGSNFRQIDTDLSY